MTLWAWPQVHHTLEMVHIICCLNMFWDHIPNLGSFVKQMLKLSENCVHILKWSTLFPYDFIDMFNQSKYQHGISVLIIQWSYAQWPIPYLWIYAKLVQVITLQWRHDGHHGVSNHQSHDCLLNCLFRCRWKKTSKLRVTGFCAGEFTGGRWIPRTNGQ